MPEDRSDTIDYHSSVQIPPVLFEYQHSIVDTTSEWTGFTSKHTSKARSYTEGYSDAVKTIPMFNELERIVLLKVVLAAPNNKEWYSLIIISIINGALQNKM